MKRSTISLIALAALSMAGAASAGTNIVTNPGFETGDLSGWNSAAWVVEDGIAGLSSNSGDFFALTQCLGADCITGNPGASLSQDLATVAGQHYVLSFSVATNDLPPSEVQVQWGSAVVADLNSLAVNGRAYTTYSVPVIATSATTTLTFLGRQDNGALALDDVSVVAAVPEPATYGLMAAGLVVVVGLSRRGRRAG